MARRKLVFFTSAAADQNEGPAWSAYHFALVAQRAGLDAEVRLAGDAVSVLKRDSAEDGPIERRMTGRSLGSYMREAVRTKLFVSA